MLLRRSISGHYGFGCDFPSMLSTHTTHLCCLQMLNVRSSALLLSSCKHKIPKRSWWSLQISTTPPSMIHFPPSVFCTGLIQFRVAGGLEPIPALDEKQCTPWTGHQFITGPHRDKRDKSPATLILTTSFYLIKCACYWTVGGGQSTQREFLLACTHIENVQTPHRKAPVEI